MKDFVSKPILMTGEQFDGTRESAKKVTDWVKAVIKDDEYQCAELKEAVSRWGFLDTPITELSQNTLVITTNKCTFYLNRDDWLVQFDENGRFTTYTDARLNELYSER